MCVAAAAPAAAGEGEGEGSAAAPQPGCSGAEPPVPPRSVAELAASAASPAGSAQSALREAGLRAGVSVRHSPQKVTNAHYVAVAPETTRCARTRAVSAAFCRELGLRAHPDELCVNGSDEAQAFAKLFSGNALLPGLDAPWASVYGCHVHGAWCGQLGDGRAVSLGDVSTVDGRRLEVQLKGAGRTPFSRGFDGKAVVRSCVREFLASEAMAALGVRTTRALSVVETCETAKRAWYGESRQETRPGALRKYRPDTVVEEKCAVMCRAAPCFVRFAQLELFALREARGVEGARQSTAELRELAEFARAREFGDDVKPGDWAALARAIAARQAELIVGWLRVGYVQGNMNSDNALVGGHTLDYGPFAFMEAYDPEFQPFTSDPEGKFCYALQPQAGMVNVATLARALGVLAAEDAGEGGEGGQAAEALALAAREAYAAEFEARWREARRTKLGLSAGHLRVDELHGRLTLLMERSGADYTLCFRLLAAAADGFSDVDAAAGMRVLAPAFGRGEPEGELGEAWREWMADYQQSVAADAHPSREAEMARANPKFILRNWMAMEAYERADKGDWSRVEELSLLLERPYDEQDAEQTERYFRATPEWARDKGGVAFLS